MDNAPCHPKSFIDCFSNVKVIFLPKKTTSMLQPLDADIIINVKVKYRKKLSKFVILRISSNVKVTHSIQEVSILKGISKSAWGEVPEQTIINCFHKCGFRKKHPDVQVLDKP